MARIRLNDSSDGTRGFVTAYLEQLESAEGICLEFYESDRPNEGMVRFILTRSEAAGLIGKVAMLLARGHGKADDALGYHPPQ